MNSYLSETLCKKGTALAGPKMLEKKRRALAPAMLILALVCSLAPIAHAQPSAKPSPKQVLAFYSTTVEKDHVLFAEDALKFYAEAAQRDGYIFDSTTNWDDLNATRLAHVDLILWLDDAPHTEAQRRAFEAYMQHGGGWFGFHAAGYNDESTHWPWFVDFLGGAVFYGNNWPPLPAQLNVDDPAQPATQRLPGHFTSPANEWYIWKPSPRANKDVRVLLTLDPSNYPLGFKDIIKGGDLPAVWTNTRYRMLYSNMGHGDKIFTTEDQNHFFEDALLWLLKK
jgi:type 1 glutamine amidotransferase